VRGVGRLAAVGAEPGVNDFFVGPVGVGVGPCRVLPDAAAGHNEGEGYRAYADCADRRLVQLAPEKKHDRRAKGRQQRDQIDMVEENQLLAPGF
jgi:hypothetical protein